MVNIGHPIKCQKGWEQIFLVLSHIKKIRLTKNQNRIGICNILLSTLAGKIEHVK